MEVVYYENNRGHCPVESFIDSLETAQKSKAFAYLGMLEIAGNALRMPHSRHLASGIFELRPTSGGVAVRLLYFFDTTRAVVTNGFIKKTRATPRMELKLANERRTDYFERKDQP